MTALSNPDEATLISGLTAGDDNAWRQAIKIYHGPMLAAARAIVGDKIADEVVQESWMSVMRAIGKFEGRSTLKTWLVRIASNQAKTRLRKESRTTSLEAMTDGDPEWQERFTDRGHWSRGSEPSEWGADSPDQLLAASDLRDCLDEAMGDLPEQQKLTLQLREQQGYALAEICNILDVSESNVRVLLHRARNRLYRTIEHFQSTGECCSF